MLQARTSTSASPGPATGSGTSRSVSTSGPPKRSSTTAFIASPRGACRERGRSSGALSAEPRRERSGSSRPHSSKSTVGSS